MAKRPDLVDITSITNSSTIGAINQNWDRIQEAFDNTVSLDGSVPNAMTGDLDINGNAILNVGTIDTENLTLNGQTIVDLASVPEWRSAWLTATSYAVNDLVKTSGNVYICLIAHTSGTFATDLTMVKWELMVSKGDSGGGTGDLLAANNLSDVANPATARANLSLGTVATENTVPVAKGGTGAVDAAAARTALGAQAAGATLTSLEALSLAEGDLLYATSADTLVRLPKGLVGQVLTMNSGATAPEWVTPSTTNTTLLGTITTTSGASQALAGLTLTSYKFLRLVFQGVSTNNSSGLIRVDGQTVVAVGATSDTFRGVIEIDLENGTFSAVLANSGTDNSGVSVARAGDTAITTASTSIAVSASLGSFDAGTIRVYGIK